MSVQHLTIDDTTTWFQAGDRDVFIGDVLDLATSAALRVRFSRYGRGAAHEWMVTADEALIVTKGTLSVRSAAGVRTAAAGEVVSLTKGTRVVFQGEEDGTEVVFVTFMSWFDAHRAENPLAVEDVRPLRGATRFDQSLGDPARFRKGA
jgi:ethanolamine utilization protein EutQ (cupin superfamily)